MCAFICDSCIHKKVCQSSVDGPCNEACALYTKDENFNSIQQLKGEILRLIMDDAYACSWQTLGQYRSGLVKEIAKLPPV
jgi:hypothetical protein